METLDYKVQDLRKKLNKLRYQSNTKQKRIESLMKEYEKGVCMNAEIEKAEEILEDSDNPEDQQTLLNVPEEESNNISNKI